MTKENPHGECDCCGKMGHLRQVWYLGYMETWACSTCRGEEPEEVARAEYLEDR